jgi:hypothetical protein
LPDVSVDASGGSLFCKMNGGLRVISGG